MTAKIIPIGRLTAERTEAIRTLKDTVLDPYLCSDYRAPLMLVAEAVGRPIRLIADLDDLTVAEARSALELVRRYFTDRRDAISQAIVERRKKP